MSFVKHALAQALGRAALVKLAGSTAIAHSDGGGSGTSVIKSSIKGAALGGAAGAGWKAYKGGNILKGGKVGALAGAATLGGIAAIKKLTS